MRPVPRSQVSRGDLPILRGLLDDAFSLSSLAQGMAEGIPIMRPVPCWFGHSSSWHRGATTPEGATPKLCDRCLQPVGVMNMGKPERGPQALPAVVAGQPTGKVTREWPANVTPIEKRR